MKTRIFIILLVLLFAQTYYAFADYVDGEVLVKFKKGISAGLIQDTIKAYSMNTKSAIASLGVYRLKLPLDYTVEEMVEILSEDPDIEYAEPNYIRYVSRIPSELSSPSHQQWGLENTKQSLTCNPCLGSSTGTSGSDINAITGWDTQTGADTVTIAIIDTGVDLDHPDLSSNIWINSNEKPNNGIDDDGNGYIDDINGWDFVTIDGSFVYPGEDPGPEDNDPNDFQGHGTHVAGVAAAVTDNNIGIAGVCWSCRIMALRAAYKGTDGVGYLLLSDILNAITYAVNNGAKVINLSFGSSNASLLEEDAMRFAYNSGVVSVCAAGNEGTTVSYPAAYDNYCIAVAATDNKDEQAWFSNFGPEIDVAAPGVDIYSTYIVNGLDMHSTCKEDSSKPGYGFCSGTSMASPFVAGLAGLILSQNPGYSVDQVTFKIIQAAEDVNSSTNAGFDNLLGGGRIRLQPAKIETVNVKIDDNSGACFITAVQN